MLCPERHGSPARLHGWVPLDMYACTGRLVDVWLVAGLGCEFHNPAWACVCVCVALQGLARQLADGMEAEVGSLFGAGKRDK